MSLNVNTSYPSLNYTDRNGCVPNMIVLHYTNVPLHTTLGIFTKNEQLIAKDSQYFAESEIAQFAKRNVSAHFTIDTNGEIYAHVPLEKAAFHAGKSYWVGETNLNLSSIGIEIVNLAENWHASYPVADRQKVLGSKLLWLPFADEQILAVIKLCKYILAKYTISPFAILGHSDIAVGRKLDPGPLFPWQQLAVHGIGVWPQVGDATMQSVQWLQNKLAEYGYEVPLTGKLDQKTTAAITALQLHFRAANVSGVIDLETIAIIDSLRKMKQRSLREFV